MNSLILSTFCLVALAAVTNAQWGVRNNWGGFGGWGGQMQGGWGGQGGLGWGMPFRPPFRQVQGGFGGWGNFGGFNAGFQGVPGGFGNPLFNPYNYNQNYNQLRNNYHIGGVPVSTTLPIRHHHQVGSV